MIDDPVAAMANTIAAGVAEMTDAVTAVLAEIDVAGQAVVAAFTAALAGTENLDDGTGATKGASFGPTNWPAYNHEQLYQMLRDQADVGDVSEIAAEWGRHAEVLTGHADTVREQRTALAANWQGDAAERAADRIDQLADLIDAIGARAGQVRQAAQDSADALALARNMMPAPIGQPSLTATSGTSGVASGSGSMVFAVGAVSTGGTSMFDTDFFTGSGRSRAEEVMRGYESSLHGSDALIAPPVQATADGADLTGITGITGMTKAAGFVPGGVGPGMPGGIGGGVPWSQLTHGGVPEPGVALGRGPLPPGAGGVALRTAMNQLLASGRVPGGAGGAGFSPFPSPATAPDGDKEHKRRQPNVTKGLFADERTASKPIIGE